MSSAVVSVHSSARSKETILRYLSAKGGYRNIDQISKYGTSDTANAEQTTRELLSIGLVKQSVSSGNQAAFKIALKGELAIASRFHLLLFIVIGVVALVSAIASLASIPIAGALFASTFGLFGYVFFMLRAKGSLK